MSDFRPDIAKKIVYLDQFVLSFFMKSAHPDFIAADHSTWKELLVKIDNLVERQLVVCPTSPIHESESLVSHKFFKPLERMSNHLSRGKEFLHYVVIQHEQMGKCFDAWLGGGGAPAYDFSPKAGFLNSGRIFEWESLSATFEQQRTIEKVSEVVSQRAAVSAEMERMWSTWKTETTLTAAEYEKAQLRNIVRAPLDVYDEWCATAAVPETFEQTLSYLNNIPRAMSLIYVMKRHLKDDGLSEHEALEKVRGFFASDLALTIPYARIQASLFKQLYKRANEGRKKPPSQGMMNDIEMISSYLPFCDAAFIDNECYDLLTEKGGGEVLSDFPVRLFCTKSKQEFLDYLREVECERPKWHDIYGRELYGPAWPRPFVTPF